MNPTHAELHQRLLELFRRYNSTSASQLILQILVRWGWKLIDPALPPPTIFWGEVKGDARALVPGGIFLWKLVNQKSFKDSRPRHKDHSKMLSIKGVDAAADKWGTQLALLPFDETMQTFVSAVHEWLLTCDLDGLDLGEQSEEMAMREVVSDWACFLGAY